MKILYVNVHLDIQRHLSVRLRQMRMVIQYIEDDHLWMEDQL